MELKSDYLKKFVTLFTELQDGLLLRGNALLVETIEEPELTTASGLIIATDSKQMVGSSEANKPRLGLVVAVGEGYMDDQGKKVPIDIPVGAIVMTPRYSPVEFSAWPGMATPTRDRLWIIPENQVHFYYKDWETYLKARKILN